MEVKQTNFAIIGLGGRGQGNLGELISIDGVKVVAVCDKYEDRARRGVEIDRLAVFIKRRDALLKRFKYIVTHAEHGAENIRLVPVQAALYAV